MNHEQFIKESICKHSQKYDYSYLNIGYATRKIKIRCIKHDFIFSQEIFSHLRKGNEGCKFCNSENNSKERIDSFEVFKLKAKIKNGNKYEYTEEINCLKEIGQNRHKIKGFCNNCQSIFTQKRAQLLRGIGCSCYFSNKAMKIELLDSFSEEIKYTFRTLTKAAHFLKSSKNTIGNYAKNNKIFKGFIIKIS